MASYRDLLDAIARVGAATGNPDAWKDGLTGADVAVALSPVSPPDAVERVMAKLTAAHPSVFVPAPAGEPSAPASAEGTTADAIRGAESNLARQRSAAAQLDLQVLTAIVNAHATATEGIARLSELQREVQAVVASRSDLDTQAGARELQRFLIGKIRDIADVVQHAGLDAQSKGMLADALIALYVSATPELLATESAGTHERRSGTASEDGGPTDREARPVDAWPPLSAEYDDEFAPLPDYLPADMTASGPVPSAAPAMAPAMPVMQPFGGGPSSVPFGTSGPAGSPWPDLFPAGLSGGEFSGDDARGPNTPDDSERTPEDPGPETEVIGEESPAPPVFETEPTPVVLPDGDTVIAPSPPLASVISAVVAGAPIPTAFGWQGMTIPAPGSPVAAPLDPGRLVPGDIAVLADRHALALGDGRVVLDNQIQPISSAMGPGFIGWLHPPEPDPTRRTPVPPVPDRSAATAPS